MRIEVIIPKKEIFNVSLFKRATDSARRATAEQALRDFRATTSTWNHKPHFSVDYDADAVTVGTDDARYAGINDGVGRHPITAHGRWLVFQSSYHAKTSPGSLSSGYSSRSGSKVLARSVQHHIKARHFTDVILARTERPFINRMFDAIVKANS